MNKLSKVVKFLEYCFSKRAVYGVGLISNRDSLEYTDEMFNRIFPSWDKLKFNDPYIPDELYDIGIKGIKDANIMDVKKYYEAADMEKEFSIIKDLKDDYKKISQFGGLYNYAVRLANKYIESSNPSIVEHYASLLATENMMEIVDDYKLGIKKFLSYISQKLVWALKGYNKYQLRYDEKKKRYEKEKQFRKWEDFILKTKNRLPTQQEFLKWEDKFLESEKNKRTTSKNTTKIHEYVNPSDTEGGRDQALDNIFSNSVSNIRMNPNDLKDLKHNLYNILKDGMTPIQKKYLQMVLVDRDPKLWIGEGNSERINQSYLAKKLNTSKTTIKNQLVNMADKISRMLQNSGDFEAMRDFLYENISKRADVDKKNILNKNIVKDLLSKLLKLNKKLF